MGFRLANRSQILGYLHLAVKSATRSCAEAACRSGTNRARRRFLGPGGLWMLQLGHRAMRKMDICSRPLTLKSRFRAEEAQSDGSLISLEKALQCECGARSENELHLVET